MRKLVKKIILNGLVRVLFQLLTSLTTFYNSKFNAYNVDTTENCSLNIQNKAKKCRKNNEFNRYTNKFTSSVKISVHSSGPNSSLVNRDQTLDFKTIYLKFKWILLSAIVVILYVTLNNYLIIFIYMKPLKLTNGNLNRQFTKENRIVTSFTINKETDTKVKSTLINNIPTALYNRSYTYIDPEDLKLANLKINEETNIKYLDEAFFSQNSNSIIKSQCMLPKLDPYDQNIMQFVKQEPVLKCNPKQNWIYVENGLIRISKDAHHKHGTILCAYIPLYRGHNDFSVYEGNRIFPIMDNFPLITDFFKIDCRSKDGGIYSNIHSGIAYESTLHFRHKWNPMPKKALGYNVLMFGFDSVSRMSWIRMLPKSYEYMIREGFIVLKGYNIVGDGTPQALLPILTGKKETELPESRRGFANASFVDVFPWIWKEYKKSGYVTQWAEDMQSIGTFQLRMLGFKQPPVDHYMRVFYLEAERYYNRFRRLCLGSISRHQNMINWVKEFFLTYDKKPKFSFIFHSEASHNHNNPLNLLDDDLLVFLKYLKSSGIMDTTVLLFMSDHGVRVSDLRQYSQGKLEERLPFFSIKMPKKFQENYPEAMRFLRLNSRKLTTPFDINETLKNILKFDYGEIKNTIKEQQDNEPMPRGISLFKNIPQRRSCKDALIEAHWCSCLDWINLNIFKDEEQTVNKKDPNITDEKKQFKQVELDVNHLTKTYTKFVSKLAVKAVNFINSLIDEEFKKYCETLLVQSIERLSR